MLDDGTRRELELRDYLDVMRRRKGIVVLSLVVLLGAAMIVVLSKVPQYEGVAEVLLQPGSTDSIFDPNPVPRYVDPDRAVQTEIQVLKSQPVKAAVRKKLGRAYRASANPVGRTDVIQVRVRDPKPGSAAAAANAYAHAYVDFRRDQAVNELLSAGQEVQRRIDDLQDQIGALTARIDRADSPERPAEATLGQQRDQLVQQQAVFKQRLEQLQAEAALKTGGAQLVTEALPPRSPVEPKPLRTAVVASALGLILGVGLAFLVDYLDDSLKTKDDVERAAHGLPVLGLIPVAPDWRIKDEARLVSALDPSSAASEAYRTLRTSIHFLALERPMRTIQITSPNPEEGKTTTLANLAIALARAGDRVAVACCDLRRPRVHEFFGLSDEVGFTSVLLGELPLLAALQPVPGHDRLVLLASGPLPPNPSELLSSGRTAEVLESLQAEADFVLIDSPPVLPVADALVLSRRVDATLVVCAAGSTTAKEFARSIELLRQVDAPLVGSVLNGVGADGSYGYPDKYRYERATSIVEPAEVPVKK